MPLGNVWSSGPRRRRLPPAACRHHACPLPPGVPTATCSGPSSTYIAGPASAPSLSDGGNDDHRPSTSGRPPPQPPTPQGPSPLRQLYKRTLKQLANLKLAIAELAAIAALSSVGTVIKQGEPYSYYVEVGRQLGGRPGTASWLSRNLVLQSAENLPGLIFRSTC